MNIIGHMVIKGVPFINGKKAVWDKKPYFANTPLADAFSQYKCPECGSHLSKDDMICLRGCHLSAASFMRFQELMGHAVAEVRRQERLKEQLKKESGVLGDILGQIEFGRDD